MDNFHHYLKKQLIEYIEVERQKGVSLEKIEKVLIDAGHKKNIIDEVFLELEKEKSGGHKTKHSDPVEKDLISQLKNAFSQFMAKSNGKEVKDAQKDLEKTDTKELVKEVIEEAEVIEEKTMLESAFFFIYLVFIGLLIIFSAAGTDSQIINVIIGFIPAILSVFISFFVVYLADNVPLYVFIPVIISSIFYGVAKFTGLLPNLDAEGLAIVNFLVGFLFNVLIIYIRFLKPKNMRRKVIKRDNTREEIKDLKKEFNM